LTTFFGTISALGRRLLEPAGWNQLVCCRREQIGRQLKQCNPGVQNGSASVINCGKATADRHIKLIRIRDFLAVSAESGCNIGKAPVLSLPA
jgi:hypothetical protein